ncbi:MAG: SOS response-associated peptidase [Emcibacter sp.]|nr:SOS response-associated peptidase [Emcibacter sp.]
MCGRYALTRTAYEKFLESMAVGHGRSAVVQVPDRYNIAPAQPIAVIRLKGSDRDQPILPDEPLPQKEAVLMRWGLVPSWAKEMTLGRPMINARSETIAAKPSFRGPFRRRKCLVPASGFYEWRRARTPGAASVPYYSRLPKDHVDGRAFAFAGIWEIWMGPHGEDWLETVSLITKPAIPLMKVIHHRSPVIVDPEDYDLWLRPMDPLDPEIFRRLSARTEADLRLYEVSPYVNNVRNDGPQSIEAAKGRQYDLF